jgi:hypothetical protein
MIQRLQRHYRKVQGLWLKGVWNQIDDNTLKITAAYKILYQLCLREQTFNLIISILTVHYQEKIWN